MPADLTSGPEAPPADELAAAEGALRVLQQAVHAIATDDLTRPTPCREFDVAALTDHLLNSIALIGGAVGARLPDRNSDHSVEQQIVAAARPALDAWHRRGLQGTVPFGSQEAPAAYLAGIMSLELLIHAWDYAVAVDRPVDVPESLTEYVLGIAQRTITPEGRIRAGFDDPVDVPDGAPPLDRLVAFTGRAPVSG